MMNLATKQQTSQKKECAMMTINLITSVVRPLVDQEIDEDEGATESDAQMSDDPWGYDEAQELVRERRLDASAWRHGCDEDTDFFVCTDG